MDTVYWHGVQVREHANNVGPENLEKIITCKCIKAAGV